MSGFTHFLLTLRQGVKGDIGRVGVNAVQGEEVRRQ
jgi:hypothetical protein